MIKGDLQKKNLEDIIKAKRVEINALSNQLESIKHELAAKEDAIKKF
jgi:hypothetical protein